MDEDVLKLGVKMHGVAAGNNAFKRAKHELANTRDTLKRLQAAKKKKLVSVDDMPRWTRTVATLLERESSLLDQIDHFDGMEAGPEEVAL